MVIIKRLDRMKSELCKISICVPIYNTEKYIERCAKSLFNQSYENIEYIFVNDCSHDNSINILNEVISHYPQKAPHIKIISHQSNQGLAGARLTGLNNASGDYVWFVDSDDYIDDSAVENLAKYLSEDADLIVFSYIEEQENIHLIRVVNSVTVNSVLLHSVSPSIWKCIIKREVLYKNNILPELGMNYMEDFLMLSRLVLVCKKVLTLNNLYLYHYNRYNLDSMMNTINLKALEQCAMVVSLVDSYYKQMDANKKYHKALLVMMSRRFVDLYNYDPSNKYCLDLGNRIKQSSSFFYMLLKAKIPNKLKELSIMLITRFALL